MTEMTNAETHPTKNNSTADATSTATDDQSVTRLPQLTQLSQLVWYLNEHHPIPSTPNASSTEDEWQDWAFWYHRLPDQLTHTAMMLLGTAVDHTMPHVAATADVTTADTAIGTMFFDEANTSDTVVLAFADEHSHPAMRLPREFAWHPLLAAIAATAKVRIIAVTAEGPAAAQWWRDSHQKSPLVALGAGTGVAQARKLAENFDQATVIDLGPAARFDGAVTAEDLLTGYAGDAVTFTAFAADPSFGDGLPDEDAIAAAEALVAQHSRTEFLSYGPVIVPEEARRWVDAIAREISGRV